MAEYIEREALIAEYDRVHIGEAGGARKLMVEAPAADVVEVVRCKDCMYYHSISKQKYCTKHIDCWGEGEIYTDEDDFCSYGERWSNDESV